MPRGEIIRNISGTAAHAPLRICLGLGGSRRDVLLLLLLRWFVTSEGRVLAFEQSLATSQREICPGQDKPCHILKIQPELVTVKSRFTSAQHQFSQGDRCSLSRSVYSGSWFFSMLCITVLEILPIASKITLYSISARALKQLYKNLDLFSMLRLTAAPGHGSGCQDAAGLSGRQIWALSSFNIPNTTRLLC